VHESGAFMSASLSHTGLGLRALLAIFALSSLSACDKSPPPQAQAAGAPSNQKQLRIGYQKASPFIYLRPKGSLEKILAKQDVKVDWFEFPGGPQILEALNSDAVDIAYAGEAPPIFAQAAADKLVYLASEPPSPESEGILAPKDSPLHTIADLKGKAVALNKASNVQYVLVRALESVGLTYEDVRPVFLPPADARAAFEAGRVDAWATWDPYLADAETSLGARVIASAAGLTKNSEFYLGRRAFCESSPEVVRVVLRELRRIDTWLTEHPDEATRIAAPVLGITPAAVKKAIVRGVYGLGPIDDDLIAAQQRIADTFLALRVLPHPVQIRDALLSVRVID
jgi:sulfonate transport system substrate-binding protein